MRTQSKRCGRVVPSCFVGLWTLAFAAASLAQTEQGKLTADDADANARFGRSVALCGDTAVIGSLSGDAPASESGSAYVFVRTGTVWMQQAKLTADDAASGDQFGFAVAIDGDTLVVGSYADDHAGGPNAGSAYVFVRSGVTWSQQAKLTAGDAAQGDYFGRSVTVEGDTAVVGSYTDDDGGTNTGSAYVFVRDGTTWTEQSKLTADDGAIGDLFGESVSLSGDTVLIGSHLDDDIGTDSGSAYLFIRQGVTWSQQAKLLPSDGGAGDHFAESVALLGDTALVGSVHISENRGAAYVFVRDGTTWSEQAKLTADDASLLDLFGFAVAMAPETAVIGCFLDDDLGTNSGSAYVFTRSGITWSPRSKLTASDGFMIDQFGLDVAASGDTVLVGSHRDDDAGSDSGSAYAYLSASSPWVDLGGASPGALGYPDLSATGSLVAGSTLTLDLDGAPPDTPMLAWLSTTSSPIAVLGGTLHTNPPGSQFLRFTDGAGAWSDTAPWPPGVPAGSELFLQFVIQDLSVAAGLILSNARNATTP